MIIISRAQWGARKPKDGPVYVAPDRRRYFIVHHSGGPVDQAVRAIQDWCMDGRGFNDIDYNHLVRGDTGEIYEGRGWDVQGAHTAEYNAVGVGVCIIGTDQASDAAKRAVRWLYAQYYARCGSTLSIRGHRDLATTGTSCPGDRVYAWVHAGMPAPSAPSQVQPKEIVDVDETTLRRIVGEELDKRVGDIVRRYNADGTWVPDTDPNPRMTVASAVEYAGRDGNQALEEVRAVRREVAGLREVIVSRSPAGT